MKTAEVKSEKLVPLCDEDRTEPLCPYFFECGGCQLQQMTYEAQLKWKQAKVIETLKKFAYMLFDVPAVLPSPLLWNYRSRIQLHCNRKGEIGFYKERSHQIIEIDSCLVAHPQLNEKLAQLKKNPPVKAETVELRLDEGSGFIQNNPEQNKRLVQLVLQLANLTGSEKVLDLYCGGGNFTVPLAKLARIVWGVELDRQALEGARRLVAAQSKNEKYGQVRFFEGETERWLKQFKTEFFEPDLVVTNPPRAGMESGASALVALKPSKIIYVSCNPQTFAKDLRIFLKAGYTLKICQPLDMFPQTTHIELVAVFSRTTA